LHQNRLNLLRTIESRRRSKAILYATGDRPGLETEITGQVYEYFVDILERFGEVHRISLVLYTQGGDHLTAWSLVNLIRQYCKRFEVILPAKAHDAGTLLSLGADCILMTKQATLSAIEPSVESPLNPDFGEDLMRHAIPLNEETIHNYLDFALAQIGEHDPHVIKDLILDLANKIHPLVLGEAYRAAAQLQAVATKLLHGAGVEESAIDKIVSFLCSESGHRYLLHRNEAHSLGLPVERPHETLCTEIKTLHRDVADELALRQSWKPDLEPDIHEHDTFHYTTALLESTAGLSWRYAIEGDFLRLNNTYEAHRTFEGWKPQTPS